MAVMRDVPCFGSVAACVLFFSVATAALAENIQLPHELVDGIQVYKYENGKIHLGFTAIPMFRIVRFGLAGKQSIVLDNIIRESGGKKKYYRCVGHRFWTADEDERGEKDSCQLPGTINARREADTVTVTLTGEVSSKNGLSQGVEVVVQDGAFWVDVKHSLFNHSAQPVKRSIYTITQVPRDGLCFTRLARKGSEERLGLIGFRWLSRIMDPRYAFVGDFFLVRHVSGTRNPNLNIGVHARSGFVGFARDSQLFAKTFAYDEKAAYPYDSSTVMFYASQAFMEIEDASPLTVIPPGEKLEYKERWFLLDGIEVSEDTDSLNRATEAIRAVRASVPGSEKQ